VARSTCNFKGWSLQTYNRKLLKVNVKKLPGLVSGTVMFIKTTLIDCIKYEVRKPITLSTWTFGTLQ